MNLLISRVKKGRVTIAGEVVSSIGRGIALFVGIDKGDRPSSLESLAEQVANLRIFESEDGKIRYSVKDLGLEILCIPNFTLCATTDKGRRPSFANSMEYHQANKLFDDFIPVLEARGISVESGVFGAYMNIDLKLDGPVNIIINSN